MSPPAEAPLAPRPVVLLVDDEAPVRAALRRSLRNLDAELVLAASGDDALAVVAGRRVDVVVADQRMPGMTGLELLAAVRARSPRTVRMLLAGDAPRDAAGAALRAGDLWLLLEKPWDDRELAASLHLACEKVAAEDDLADLEREVARLGDGAPATRRLS